MLFAQWLRCGWRSAEETVPVLYQLNLHLLLLDLSGLQEEKEEGGWLLQAAGVLASERQWWRSTTGPAAPPLLEIQTLPQE